MKNIRIKIPCKPAFGHPAAHASHLGARLGVMGIVVVPAPGSENEAVATGVAMVIAPGGGHSQLVIDKEGWQIAEWCNDRGIAALVLQCRRARAKDSHYTVEGDALPDAA